MKKVGFIGWRGMVGSVLMSRMAKKNDFMDIDSIFFTTSQLGEKAPTIAKNVCTLQDAYDLSVLSEMDVIVTCQGSNYTKKILGKLREIGWIGYWIDAASYLRMDKKSILVLDPINRIDIELSIEKGIKNFVGANCTVSLLMLAIHGLLKENLVDWISTMSYQAISGSGAKAMIELLKQFDYVLSEIDFHQNILTIEKHIQNACIQPDFPLQILPNALAFNLLPWIDSPVNNGQTREEWKAQVEMNKILNYKTIISVDGICTRVPVLRSHSQALTLQLKKDVSLDTIQSILESANSWVHFIENNQEETLKKLMPMTTSNTLNIVIGRLKRSQTVKNNIHLFTVGDQLLWGAAEPLRRTLSILLKNIV